MVDCNHTPTGGPGVRARNPSSLDGGVSTASVIKVINAYLEVASGQDLKAIFDVDYVSASLGVLNDNKSKAQVRTILNRLCNKSSIIRLEAGKFEIVNKIEKSAKKVKSVQLDLNLKKIENLTVEENTSRALEIMQKDLTSSIKLRICAKLLCNISTSMSIDAYCDVLIEKLQNIKAGK